MSSATSSPIIRLRGVRQNNLKGFDLDLPQHRLIVVTGLSGSGKSSLAFETLFAEGQRRYIETFSPYARQFFDRMDKPRVDSIEGIPPAIAIEQRNAVRTTRSTVGTMTEICDYLKVLWPQLARLHCRGCGQPVRRDTPMAVWDIVAAAGPGRECLVTFDLPLTGKMSLADSLALVARQGYQRLVVDGQVVRLDKLAAGGLDKPAPSNVEGLAAGGLDRPAPSNVEGLAAGGLDGPGAADITRAPGGSLTVVQDRLRVAPASRSRFIEACEQAYHFGRGRLAVRWLPDGTGAAGVGESSPASLLRFSAGLHCAACDLEYGAPTPALFSFNHPLGACPACKGFGRIISIDYERALPDRSLTLAAGAVKPWRTGFSAECQQDLAKFCRARGVAMNVPFRDLPPEHQRWVTEGDPDYGIDDEHQWPRAWYGVKGYFRWLESKAYKMHVRVLLSRYRAYTACPACGGRRLKPDALLWRIEPRALDLAGFYALPIADALQVVEDLAARRRPATSRPSPADHALAEVRSRLAYLVEVGLGYLTLDRPTRSLSGGETERVNLTTCLGSRLVNTLFVLDEPSVGLHARDTGRLIRILERLRDAGNTVVVVEHEASVMRAADQVVDLGPGHGETGGQIVFQGTFPALRRCAASLTGRYLSGKRRFETPPRRPVGSGANPTLRLSNITRHNLRDLAVEIPLGRLVCVTGVSGSGKSTLVREVLFPELEIRLGRQPGVTGRPPDEPADTADDDSPGDAGASGAPGVGIEGWEALGRVVMVDQSSLGRTPRSNPAVYLGAFDHIRDLFAASDVARQQGLNASAFSFNSARGQCERCRGAGFEKIEMQFLSDVFIRCPDCDGRRYREHILQVKIQPPSPEAMGSPKSEVRSPKSPSPAPRPQTPDPGPETRNPKPETRDPTPPWSIADVLDATAEDAHAWLVQFPDSRPARRAAQSLAVLLDVGLGYLRLGQPINTLSGGESQRLKLAAHLAEAVDDGEVRSPKSEVRSPDPDVKTAASGVRHPASAPRTLFLFDEPTTGLHFEDVRILIAVFQRLVDAGHSVIVIEHHLDVIRSADWVLDLGPEGGAEGGRLVVAGTPEDVAACVASHTGRALGGDS